MDGLTTLATTGTERGLLTLSQLLRLMPRLNTGGTDTTDGDGLTTLATTGTERGLPTPSQLLRPMPKPSLGGTEATDGDGLTILAITGMDIMDGVGHTAITGVNKYWSGWMMSKTLTEAF